MSSVRNFFKPLKTSDESEVIQHEKLSASTASKVGTIENDKTLKCCSTERNTTIDDSECDAFVKSIVRKAKKKAYNENKNTEKNARNKSKKTGKSESLNKDVDLSQDSSPIVAKKQLTRVYSKGEDSLNERGSDGKSEICTTNVERKNKDSKNPIENSVSLKTSKKNRLSLQTIKKEKKYKKTSNKYTLDCEADIGPLVNDVKSEKNHASDSDACLSPSNAFQIMMESRKKRIGTNSPGKEIDIENDATDAHLRREIKAKRKLSLEKLAESKGAQKNRDREAIRDQMLKKTIEKRKKSFKVLLQIGTNKERSSNGDLRICENSDQPRKKKLSLISKKKLIIDDVFVTLQSDGKRKRDGHLHVVGNLPKKSKIYDSKIPDSKSYLKGDEEFLDKLSPSLRKKDGMLSYFKKIENESSPPNMIGVCDDEDDDAQIIKVKFSRRVKKKTKSQIRNKKSKVKLKSNEEEISEKLCPKSLTLEKQASKMTSKILNIANVDIQPSIVCMKADVVESVTSIGVAENIRPRRGNCKKPFRYIQESSEESNTDSEVDGYHIFTPKKNNHKKIDRPVISIDLDVEDLSNMDMVSPIKIINIKSSAAIRCVRSPSSNALRKSIQGGKLSRSDSQDSISKNVKLAPLFLKSVVKPIVDPETLAAKLKFLQSGMPDYIRKQQERLPCILNDFNIFPTVSHVQQIPYDLDCDFSVWRLPTVMIANDFEHNTIDETSNFDFNCVTFNDYLKVHPPVMRLFVELANSKSYSCKIGLQEIKRRYAIHPVNKIYSRLKQKFQASVDSDLCLNITNQPEGHILNSGSGVNDLNAESGDDASLNKKFSLWTEKYRPTASGDIIGNMRSINAIKKWLESWIEYNESNKNYKKKIKDSESSSDFVLSDCESRDSSRLPNNMIVIVGPNGSGKTSSVYAIANELGMNVLEVNAGSKRTGKRILTDLQEATQSHKVLTKMNSDSSISNSFSGLFKKSSNDSDVINIEDKPKTVNLKKSSKSNGQVKNCNETVKIKKKRIPAQTANSETQKMSLMLIEDADIIFEEDDGFVNALAQIVQSSKRPVILVATDVKCSHLQRFMSEKNVIHFYPLMGALLGPWLDILILIECRKLLPQFSCRFLDFCKGDMRTAILHLQYWLLGAKKNIKLECKSDRDISKPNENDTEQKVSDTKFHQKMTEIMLNLNLYQELSYNLELDNIWWNISDIFNHLGADSSAPLKESLKVTSENLDSIYNLFESLSSIDVMQSHSNTNVQCFGMVKHPWQFQLTDGLSESEDLSLYCSHKEFSATWCKELISLSCKPAIEKLDLQSNYCIDKRFHREEDLRWKKLQKKQTAHSELCEQIPLGSQMDRTAMSVDYMAALRSICRSETERSGNNMKRNNRFHHYLKSISFDSSLEVFDETCEILNNGASSDSVKTYMI